MNWNSSNILLCVTLPPPPPPRLSVNEIKYISRIYSIYIFSIYIKHNVIIFSIFTSRWIKNSIVKYTKYLYYCLFKITEKKHSRFVCFFALLYRNRIDPWPPNRGAYRTVTSVYRAVFTLFCLFHCYVAFLDCAACREENICWNQPCKDQIKSNTGDWKDFLAFSFSTIYTITMHRFRADRLFISRENLSFWC